MDLGLRKKNVIIVGGSNGIGLSIAKGFLEENANVHVISRNRDREVIGGLKEAYSSSFFFYSGDATDENSLTMTREQILNNSKQEIDIVVSNVGSGKGTQTAVNDNDEWNQSWDTNFNSALNVSRVFSPELIKAKGSIIFISSIAGMEFIGAPTAYSTAKSAIIAFSKSLSHRLAPSVRVNVVSPGNIWIDNGTWDVKMKENPGKVSDMLNEKVPMRRFGLPEEVCDLVLFLSSNRAAFITGGCFVIDGGQTISF
jgi:3-oxoacyl-[acyl-carrier protein] reductase